MTTKKTTKRVVKKLSREPETGEFTHTPDSETAVDQVKSWNRFKPQIKEDEEFVLNNWKYACIAILLGIVVSMIIFTPTITSMFDACLVK